MYTYRFRNETAVIGIISPRSLSIMIGDVGWVWNDPKIILSIGSRVR